MDIKIIRGRNIKRKKVWKVLNKNLIIFRRAVNKCTINSISSNLTSCSSKHEYSSTGSRLHLKLSLKSVATTPPWPLALGVFKKIVVQRQQLRKQVSAGLSQVSVKNRKSKICDAIKSWSINILFPTDLTFSSSALTVIGYKGYACADGEYFSPNDDPPVGSV